VEKWWSLPLIIAGLLIASGGLYIRRRWRRSPQAYRAMTAVAVTYLVAGVILGVWTTRFATTPDRLGPTAISSPIALVPSFSPTPGSAPSVLAPFDLGSLHFDPARAILPDSRLTPGDTFPDATKENVCTPGWASEHRHVTEAMRDEVYAEYGRTRGKTCCEVDHLIPLELGGSNELKNLWPQPEAPRPAWPEKDQLENELHRRVCADQMTLADAQRCISSNWVTCWQRMGLQSNFAPAGS